MINKIIPETIQFTKLLLQKTQDKQIILISHFDTDGITSAAIMTETLKRLERQFTTKILKQLTDEEIYNIPKDKTVIFTDLGSGSLAKLAKLKNEIFIIDHHELSEKQEFLNDQKNIHLFNPHIHENKEPLCGAELSYLISKQISEENKDLAHLAVLGMVGDVMEKNITKTRNQIINDANVKVKKGILIYPSTRPLDKALEFSSRPFIPNITGNKNNILELLREAGIERVGNKYKALIDLNEHEMKNLVTALTLRMSSKNANDHIGNLFLIKFFNKIEDARELSAMINACSRMDQPNIALLLCLGNNTARKTAEKIYVKYRQNIISGLKYIEGNGKIEGREYVIINTKNNVKDTIIGTLASILSFSSVYKKGKIIIAMAYNEDKIKISTRLVGRNPESPRNLKQFIESIMHSLGTSGEFGGHKHAAGCTINQEDEQKFIELVKKKLEYEMVKV
tara:strand:+ start:1105 stop:2463 length:1359 start_codon:yes stop_codon:yes gene_type:complete